MRLRVSGRALSAVIVLSGVYTVGLFTFAPATLLDVAVNRASDGRLRVAEARGTLWNGVGQLDLLDSTKSKGVARTVSWRFRPQGLVSVRLDFEVNVGDSPKSFGLSLSPTSVKIANAEVSLPAVALGLIVPGMAVIGPIGELLVRAPELSLSGKEMAGSATLTWLAAGSALSPVSPLGDYELRMQTNASPSLTLRTLKGPLYLTGRETLKSDRSVAFIVTARVDPPLQPQLTPFLRLIAVERAPGTFELQANGGLDPAPGLGSGR